MAIGLSEKSEDKANSLVFSMAYGYAGFTKQDNPC
jgi:hypothetical protein